MDYRQPFRGEYPITQAYGEKITSSFHTGIDYGCPLGTEILASAGGQVMFAGFSVNGWGGLIILRHDDGKSTLYAHLSKTLVKSNAIVKQGDVIGLSGNTGNSTGPHLHFEARSSWAVEGSHKDPVTFLPLRSVDDSIIDPAGSDRLPEGKYRIACAAAYIRSWDGLQRVRLLDHGERVYIYKDVKYSESGLPFRFIGAGLCIAEYDCDGTKILEA